MGAYGSAILELSQNPEETVAIVEKGLKHIPNEQNKAWGILLCTYGRALHRLGVKNASEAFEKSLELDSSNYTTRQYYALALMSEEPGDPNALQLLEEAYVLAPENQRSKLQDMMQRVIASQNHS